MNEWSLDHLMAQNRGGHGEDSGQETGNRTRSLRRGGRPTKGGKGRNDFPRLLGRERLGAKGAP